MQPRGDDLRHDAEDPNRRKHQRHEAEHTERRHRKALTADRRIANGKDVIERQYGVRLVRLGHVA